MSAEVTAMYNFTEIQALSRDYGDAFYILDMNVFKKNYNDFIGSFRSIYPKSNIGYSYKTNYTPSLCRTVNSFGGYAEVVSEMELELAIRVGVDFAKIIYNGPYKSKESFEQCLLLGGCVNISSEYELDMLYAISKQNNDTRLHIGIRCNFDILGGRSRFGFDVDSPDFGRMMVELRNYNNIFIKGFHCHLPNRDLASYKERIKSLLDLSDQYFEKPPSFIDCGGGYFGRMPESLRKQFSSSVVSFDEYAKVIATAVQDHYASYSEDERPELILEPGSALVANAMLFFAKVINIKSLRGRNVATIAGSNFNINPTASSINLPMSVVSSHRDNNEDKTYDVAGYTCIESDILYKDYQGHILKDDYVCFENVGSYSVVMKPPFILPNVPVITIDEDGVVDLLKRKERFNDIFSGFFFS